jgi:uncharacterized protein
MSVQHFTADNRNTIHWASGTSTQLFVHPADGNFAERDFLFRISTATVEAEESTFTFFEGITRHLMILKGKLELIHEGRYTRYLEPYDQDVFSGEWKTYSKGKVTDFNLMLKDGAAGSLMHHRIEQGANATFIASEDYYFIYVASGKVILSSGNTATAEDLLWVSRGSALSLLADESCDLVVINVAVKNI